MTVKMNVVFDSGKGRPHSHSLFVKELLSSNCLQGEESTSQAEQIPPFYAIPPPHFPFLLSSPPQNFILQRDLFGPSSKLQLRYYCIAYTVLDIY